MFLNQRGTQPERIVGNELLQRRQFAIGIIQSVAAMNFAQMDLVLEAQRMAELVNGIGFSLATSLDHFPHVPEAAIEEVHPAAFDDKPAREGKAKSQFVRLARTARKKSTMSGENVPCLSK